MEDDKTKSLSEQKTDNKSTAPWEPPSPQEKQAARPVKRALEEALSKIDSKEKADEIAAEIEVATMDEKAEDVAQSTPTPSTVEEAARKVERSVKSASEEESAKQALTETARQVVAAEGREREVLSKVVQEAIRPEQQGILQAEEKDPRRDLLREAILRRMAPYDALDAKLFLAINHLPHTPFANRFFYYLTYIFNGGAAWYFLIALIWILNRHTGNRVVKTATLPLALSTMLVEFPIKSYFRRKRPFIKIVQAIVIGKKPGTWSFPSGHSASAFAGAWLLHKHFPKQGPLFYLIALLVAFSRVFLGDHYPGDVVAGSFAGSLLARFFNKLQAKKRF